MTAETKHTPGPWKVQGDGYDAAAYVMGRDLLVKGGAEDRIIAVCHSYRSADRISRSANASLIAAAPDMLEALKAAAESAGFQYMLHETRDKISAALAKASLTTEPTL